MTDWSDVRAALLRPACAGTGPIQVLSRREFYDEDALPFLILGGGTVLHILPDPGFREENLAGTEDERLMIRACPGEEGWLVPEDIIGDWMARHVSCAELEDLLLSHPLYEYLTRPDEKGHSRGGHRGFLVQWAPGIPTLASLYAPEFLPDDEEAPAVNRERAAYADAVVDLLGQLEAAFELEQVEVGLRFTPPRPPAQPERGRRRRPSAA